MAKVRIIKRFTRVEMVKTPGFADMVKARCWNLLGVGSATHCQSDPATGDLIFFKLEPEQADNQPDNSPDNSPDNQKEE